MILELKDKLDLEDAFEKKLLHEQEAEETLPDARGEAVEALTALGYSPADALRAVQKVEPEVSGKSSIAVVRPGADPRTVKHVFVITDY